MSKELQEALDRAALGCGAMNDISILPLTPLQSWLFLVTVFYILYRWVTR